MEYIQLSLFGKMYSEPSPATKEKISEPSSGRLSRSSSREPLCLRFQKADGPMQTAGWVMDGALAGELSMLNTGEFPSDAVECTLSSILEDSVPEKYFLSARACEGILRRAERRGKELPPMLREALEFVIACDCEGCMTPWDYQSKRVYGADGVFPTLNSKETSGQNQQAVFVPYTMVIRSGCEGGGKGPLIQEDKSATLSTGNNQYLFAPVYCIQGNTIDRNAQQNGSGICENVAFTLNAVDRHGVVETFILDDQGGKQISVKDNGVSPTLRAEMHGHPPCVVSAGFKAGNGAQARSIGWAEEQAPTLAAEAGGNSVPSVCVAYDARGNGDGKTASTLTGVCIYYIVRRLTPTECARLQGFPDRWGDIDKLSPYSPEVVFWREVYRLDCEIKGKKIRASILNNPERLAKWHDTLFSDSGEYRMWGNGIALPCALYIMEGIVEAARENFTIS